MHTKGITDIGSKIPHGTSGSVLFIDSNLKLAQDNSNLFWNNTDKSFCIGDNINSVTLNGASQISQFLVNNNSLTDYWNVAIHRHNVAAAVGANIGMIRSKGTSASPSIVAADDCLGGIGFYGYDGVDYAFSARIAAFVDGTPGSNDMPGRISFYCSADGSQTPAEVARFSADKSFSLYGERQYWLGSQMIITDVLARDILTISAVLMTISYVNLLIEQNIQVDGSIVCNGPIEMNDTLDLNKVTGDQIRILPDNATLVGSIASFVITSTLTFDTASDSFQFIRASGEFKYTTGPSLGIPPIFFQFIPTIRATTTNMSISGTAVFYNQASVIADGVVLTYGNLFSAFLDSPQFSIANGGSYGSPSNYTCMRSEFVVNTGAAFNQRSGYRFANATGSGTLVTQIGFFCAALTKGSTANNPLFINAPDTANASGSMIDGNITFFATAGSYGGGSRVLFMANRTTAPSSDPTGGGILYAESGALKWRGSGGSVTTIAAA